MGNIRSNSWRPSAATTCFVFQDFNLLDTFSIRDNIYLPLVWAARWATRKCAPHPALAEQLAILPILDKFP